MAALVQAATNLDVPLVRALLELGAPVEQADGSNRSPLASAAEAMNGGGDAFQRSTTIVKLLLDHGASPNRRLQDGRTPVDAAEDGGNDEMLRALRTKGGRASPKKASEA